MDSKLKIQNSSYELDFLLLYKNKERHAAQAPALRERYRDPVSGILHLASSI
jgi:hypothetical protein